MDSNAGPDNLDFEAFRNELLSLTDAQAKEVLKILPEHSLLRKEQIDHLRKDYTYYKLSFILSNYLKHNLDKKEYKKYYRKYISLSCAIFQIFFEMSIEDSYYLINSYIRFHAGFISMWIIIVSATGRKKGKEAAH